MSRDRPIFFPPPSKDPHWTAIVIPIVTFALGCASTWGLQFYQRDKYLEDEKSKAAEESKVEVQKERARIAAESERETRNRVRASATEVCRLCKEWYIQVEKILIYQKSGTPPPLNDPGVCDYVNNRIILPDLLFHTTFLANEPSAKAFSQQADTFLSVLTDFKPEHRAKINKCEEILLGLTRRDGEETKDIEALRAKLDGLLQMLNHEAAKL
jgi:hypothetical protein